MMRIINLGQKGETVFPSAGKAKNRSYYLFCPNAATKIMHYRDKKIKGNLNFERPKSAVYYWGTIRREDTRE
jgi:hypothetical protein